ncbi:MAG: DNA polymerase/3'-5' exonuclease PolX [Candidatus Colwellbacteria bacterium]|nr:DNA polymerase/3'-5' exonuclease PolX [Candidatus Colwellbacteria bacterium]
MRNEEVARILFEISEYLEMQNIAFKPRAYEKAAQTIADLEEDIQTIADLEEDINDIYKKGGLKALEEIPGVGKSIAEKIEELLKTGKLKYYEGLKKRTPVDLSQFSNIEGLGPKKIKVLHQKLGITSLEELEQAAKKARIQKLEGFGPKSEENILKGIEFARGHKGRFLLGYAIPLAEKIESRLKALPGVEKAIIAGSYRRFKETVGDLDMLVVSKKPKEVMDYFVSQPEVARVLAHGKTKSSVTLENGIDVDIRVVLAKSYGAALAYFTGSKDHNVAMRIIAQKKGWKLNEYGLFDGQRQITGKTEEEIYKKLGLTYVEPEMRENWGELELSLKNKLPKLIGYGELEGDLQVQSNWSDGANSIKELAQTAVKQGLKYIAITDHTKRLAMAHGLDEKRLREQAKEIDRVNKEMRGKIKILKGSECDILKNGELDLSDDALKELDIVGVSVHSYFNLPKEEQTERIKKAMQNKNVDIIFHPTGRLINRRKAYEVDMEEIIKVAKETGTVFEIDAFPDRLDLNDENIRKSVEAGVKMSIDSDAHSIGHFGYLELGVAQARRGWAKKSDIINAWPLDKMKSFLKK